MIKKPFASRLGRLNLVASVILLAIGLVWLYPFLWPIFASFKGTAAMFRDGWALWVWPEPFTLEHYFRAWVNAKFSVYLANSLSYCISATFLTVVMSAMAGYAVARYQFPGSRLLVWLMMAMLFLPAATSIIPVFELMQSLHLLNSPLAVILALSGGMGLYTLLFQSYFKNIPQDLYDAAVMDGASFLQQFRLFLPLARPIIATTVIFTFNAAWQDYFTPLVFTLGKPELRTAAVGLRAFTGQFSMDYSGFVAAETISVIPIIIVFLMFQKQFVNGLAGAIKG
jgi:ABC-type glycerol-3-phosphate transport system permease component